MTRLAAIAVQTHLRAADRARFISGRISSPTALAEKFVVSIGGKEWTVEARDDDGTLSVAFENGQVEKMTVKSDWEPGQSLHRSLIDGNPMSVLVERLLDGWRLRAFGADLVAFVRSPGAAALAKLMPEKVAPDTSKYLLCPMPGLVVDIPVAEGQEIKAGEVLAIVEAMKMENVLKAERDGTISKVNAAKGDSLAVDDIILEFA